MTDETDQQRRDQLHAAARALRNEAAGDRSNGIVQYHDLADFLDGEAGLPPRISGKLEKCSFCGVGIDDTMVLVTAVNAAICDDCVGMAHALCGRKLIERRAEFHAEMEILLRVKDVITKESDDGNVRKKPRGAQGQADERAETVRKLQARAKKLRAEATGYDDPDITRPFIDEASALDLAANALEAGTL